MKYREKPIVVDAIQFTVREDITPPLYINIHNITFPVYQDEQNISYIVIPTIDGPVKAYSSYWILKGECGEVYSYNNKYFEGRYEKI